jgi:hypothetical protein
LIYHLLETDSFWPSNSLNDCHWLLSVVLELLDFAMETIEKELCVTNFSYCNREREREREWIVTTGN